MEKIIAEVQKMDLMHVFVFASLFSDEEKREIQPHVQKVLDQRQAKADK